ncbi:MAG: response regulator transcription factor [Sedimentibacter sp.]|uniref:response regulator transcription factor n=1 Tax=Sedimentibacter sp. TaxID=1960295 RepID=UPI0029828B19|nr:response regulator transcription factor [Sedimentibacter sp.]MDW5299927.1 response regulator transcription factor [Sedimentibacter sp.]
MKILVVDDHPLVRKGILSILACENNIKTVLEAANVNEAVNIINLQKPNLAIVDLNLGKEDGLDIIKRIKNKAFDTKFIILTSSLKKEDFIRSEEAGADGYILKDAFAEDIIYAINIVLRGRKYIDPEITKYQLESSNNIFEDLTPREYDVLVELGKGMSNFEIAKKLFISEYTVKKHVSSILLKLDLNHRTQAALLVNQFSPGGVTYA